MRFGETLVIHSRPGLRYLDYAWLKQLIAADQGQADFLTALLTEIGAVDRCFELERQRFETGSDSLTAHELRTYAVINYLAVLKIVKKHDKQLRKQVTVGETLRRRFIRPPRELPGVLPVVTTTTQQIERTLTTISFCVALHDRALFARADLQPTSALTAAPTHQCAVCLETMPEDHAVLVCNHHFCWACVATCAASGIKTCPLCRAEQSLEPVEIEIEKLLGEGGAEHSQAYFPAARLPASRGVATTTPTATAAAAAEADVGPLRVMTWNVCAITFPFAAPTAQLAAGALLGCSWHDVSHDASLLPLGRASRPRLAQQAKYIASSGADVVFLQEVCGVATVDELMRHLAPAGYEASFARRAPSPVAVASWVALCLIVAAAQLLILVEPAARLLVAPHALVWLGGPTATGALLRWLGLAAIFALRWRDSLPAQFLLGSIAGQLVMLRRTGCASLAAELTIEEFVPFDDAFNARTDDEHTKAEAAAFCTPALLQGIFNLRVRGVLRARVPVRGGGADGEACEGVLRLLTTHLPHCTDNTKLMRALAAYTRDAALDAHVVLGGDWNILADSPASSQLAPLLGAGGASYTHGSIYADASDYKQYDDQLEGQCAAQRSRKEAPAPVARLVNPLTGACGADEGATAAARMVTWDLANPMARRNEENPCDQHLDFVLVQPQADAVPASDANGANGTSSSPSSKSSSTSPRLHGLASTALETLPEELSIDGIDVAPPPPSPPLRAAPAAVLETLGTEVVLTPSFFVPGAPLSDHYGIATDFRVTRRSKREGILECLADADP